MRTSSLLWIAIAVAALAPALLAADEAAWGAPFDGLRLGITLDRTLRDPSFRVVLQNTTDAPRDVRVAGRSLNTDHRPLGCGWNPRILFPVNKLVYGAMISGKLVEVQIPADRRLEL